MQDTVSRGTVGKIWCSKRRSGFEEGLENIRVSGLRNIANCQKNLPGDSSDARLGVWLDESATPEVDQEVVCPDEVCAEDGFGYLCHLETPRVFHIVYSDCSLAGAKRSDAAAIGGDEVKAWGSAEVWTRGRYDTNLGPCVYQKNVAREGVPDVEQGDGVAGGRGGVWLVD